MTVSAGANPSTYPSGVSTSPGNYVFAQYPFPTRPRLNEYFSDFNTYAAGDWTVTSATGTSALTDGNGGKLLVSTNGLNNDIQGNQLVKKSFAFTSGSQVWFSINVELSDATSSAFMAGFGDDFSALTPTDGVYFSKATASTTMTAVIRASSTSTTITPIGTMANATAYTFSFFYDGLPNPSLYFWSTIPYAASTLSAPTAFGVPYYSGGQAMAASANALGGSSSTGAYVLTNLPAVSTNLTLGMALKGTAVAVKTATVDYLLGAEEIVARY